jgi:hypothetical protein
LMYQGKDSGHFSSLLLPNFKNEEIRKKVLAAFPQNTIQIKFKKPKGVLWEPIADIFRDLSLSDFAEDKRPEVNITLPVDQSKPKEGFASGGSASQVEQQEIIVIEGSPSQDVKPKNDPVFDDKIRKISETISIVYSASEKVDEFAQFTPEEFKIKENIHHIEQINPHIATARLALQSCPPPCSEIHNSRQELVQEFDSLENIIQTMIDLRDKFQRAIDNVKAADKKSKEAKQKGKGTSRGGKTVPASPEPQTYGGPMDVFFKVKSVMPTDDISDQIHEGCLLDLFRIEPTPMCLQSLHLSILSASMTLTSRAKWNQFFKEN